jgi:WD40 repeat protein/serine/threonine protein kinase
MIHSREEALAALAADKSACDRAAFLDRECAADPLLRQRVERRLAALGLPGGSPGGSTDTVSAALPQTSQSESPGALIGSYKLLEKLGEGGFGVVWAAEQKEPVKRRVALKIIKLGMDTEQVVARFEAERQALAMMDHPNIAKVLDAGATQLGRPYFVMELVKGVSITRYCQQARLPVEERIDLLIKVCHAIQHAHQKGIIHRDIKPSNILITLHDGVPVPKVIDFGIAKATQAELTEKTIYTQYGQFIGTPAYMSPEQAEMSGLDIDTRSDIYSLGVLLYELLTGTTPFDTEELLIQGLDAMRKIIREREPLRPSTRLRRTGAAAIEQGAPDLSRRGSLSTDLDCIVMKCLEKDRTRRYETANALAMDLVRHLKNEPVTARPPSALYKFQKAWRRNRAAYAAGAAVLVALTLGVVGLSIGLYRAGIEQENAYRAAQAAEQAAGEATAARSLAESNAEKLEASLYFNSIALAHREATARPANLKQAEALLDGCPERLRNWEWHHLKRRRFFDPVVLGGSESQPVSSVQFSPDGRSLAAGYRDGNVRIWDPGTSRMVETLPAHTGFVVSISFCPTNPRWIATAGSDDSVQVWDWQSRRKIHSWPADTAHRDYGTAYCAAFSPDGRFLAAPGEKGELAVRFAETGRDAYRLAGHERGVYSVAFSADGRWLATGSGGGTVRLWEGADGQAISTLGSKSPPIGGLAFTRDGTRLVALEFDGLVRVFDVSARKEVTSYSVRMTGAPPSIALAIHPKGDRLATAGFDGLVTLSALTTGTQVLVLREIDSRCQCVAFSPDGNRLAATTNTGRIHVWDATPLSGNEDPCLRSFSYGAKEVWAVDIAPNRLAIAAGGIRSISPVERGAPILLWQGAADRDPVSLPGYAIVAFTVAFDPTGRFLASAGDEPLQPDKADIKVWDLEARREAFPVEAFEDNPRSLVVAISRDGKRLVGGGVDGKVKVWDMATGRKIGAIGAVASEVTVLTFSTNGRYLASLSNDGVAQVWDGSELDKPQSSLLRFRAGSAGMADSLAFSPDEKRLAVIETEESVVIHDLVGNDRAVRFNIAGHRPASLVFSPNGRWVISGGMDGTLRVWDAQSGALRQTIKSHTDHILRLRARQLPEGPRMVSGSRDGTVKLWDLAFIERQLESQ